MRRNLDSPHLEPRTSPYSHLVIADPRLFRRRHRGGGHPGRGRGHRQGRGGDRPHHAHHPADPRGPRRGHGGSAAGRRPSGGPRRDPRHGSCLWPLPGPGRDAGPHHDPVGEALRRLPGSRSPAWPGAADGGFPAHSAQPPESRPFGRRACRRRPGELKSKRLGPIAAPVVPVVTGSSPRATDSHPSGRRRPLPTPSRPDRPRRRRTSCIDHRWRDTQPCIRTTCKRDLSEGGTECRRNRSGSYLPGGRSARTPGAWTWRISPARGSRSCTAPGSTTTACCASPASSCRPRRSWPSPRASGSWTSRRSPRRGTARATGPTSRIWSSSRTSSRTARRSAGLGSYESKWHTDMSLQRGAAEGQRPARGGDPGQGRGHRLRQHVPGLGDATGYDQAADRGAHLQARRLAQQRRRGAARLQDRLRAARGGAGRGASDRLHASGDRPEVPLPRPPRPGLHPAAPAGGEPTPCSTSCGRTPPGTNSPGTSGGASATLVVWDNRCTMHRRDALDPSERRLLNRAQVKGERPVAAAAA